MESRRSLLTKWNYRKLLIPLPFLGVVVALHNISINYWFTYGCATLFSRVIHGDILRLSICCAYLALECLLAAPTALDRSETVRERTAVPCWCCQTRLETSLTFVALFRVTGFDNTDDKNKISEFVAFRNNFFPSLHVPPVEYLIKAALYTRANHLMVRLRNHIVTSTISWPRNDKQNDWRLNEIRTRNFATAIRVWRWREMKSLSKTF